ncbi:Hypothetical leucine rich repeat protein [Ectocarpus siliculosus]|uniref:Hypothetical leucine rich repeat protein n=1 Tax=Ectocarpus siliculosus TaxID=2880 RepID=D7FTU9_ECTSI|nr:Hypothetical leucine rich repeat protein [Ectocarpus siliculosus]|eukprot:CBJ31476.1 Hypothetical leucine rich repeat protein [Ectocarpus siliculosus]
MSGDLTRAFLEEVVRGSGWSLAEVESLSLEGEGIRSLRGSLGGLRRLVYLNLARNNLSSLLGIEHLVSLGTLVLRENRVESIDEVGRLSCLGDLRDLDIRLNPVMATASRRHGGGRSGGSGSGRPRADVVAVLPQLVTLDGRGVREDERLPHRPRRGQQYQHQHQHWQQQRGSARFPAWPATSARSPRPRTGEPKGLATTTTTTTSSRTNATAASGSAAARAVEAFRRSSQRLGLLSAGAGPGAAAADGVAVDGGRRSLAIGVGDGDGAVEDAAPRSPLAPTTTTTPARTARGLPCCPGGNGRTAGCGDGDCAGRAGESRGGGGNGCGGPKGPTDTKCGDDVTPAARSASPVAAVLVAPSTWRPAFARVRRGEEEESAITAAGGRALAEGEVAPAAAADPGGMWFPAHGDMAERWWAREREFEARWCAREREFDARWAAREREFDLRLHESSKEFTAEMRSMLLGAHEALISSNARLVERLKAAEAAVAAAAKLASTGSPTSAPGGGATARRMWSSSSSSNAQARPATSAASSSTADPRSANTVLLLRPWPPSRSGVDGGTVSEYSDHVAAPAAGAGGAGDLPPRPPPPTDDNGGRRSRAGGAVGVIAPAVAFGASRRRSFTAGVPAASGHKNAAAAAGDMDQVQPSQGDGVVESTGKVASGTEGGKETGRGSKTIVSADSRRRVDSRPPSSLAGQRVDEGGSVAQADVSPSSCSDEEMERCIAGGNSASLPSIVASLPPIVASLPPIVAGSTVERSQEAHGGLRGRACVVAPVREATPMSNFGESSKLGSGVVAVAAASAPLAVECDGGEVFGREPEVTFSVSPSH